MLLPRPLGRTASDVRNRTGATARPGAARQRRLPVAHLQDHRHRGIQHGGTVADATHPAHGRRTRRGLLRPIGEVDVRFVGRGPEAVRWIEQATAELQKAAGEFIFDRGRHRNRLLSGNSPDGVDPGTRQSHRGHVANRITNVPGAPRLSSGRVTSPTNASKTSAPGVPGPHRPTRGRGGSRARAMAEGARKPAARTTDQSHRIAGPDGGSDEKPVGTVFIGLAGTEGTTVTRRANRFDRRTFKLRLRRSRRSTPFGTGFSDFGVQDPGSIVRIVQFGARGLPHRSLRGRREAPKLSPPKWLSWNSKTIMAVLGVPRTASADELKRRPSESWRASIIPTSPRTKKAAEEKSGDQRGLRGAERIGEPEEVRRSGPTGETGGGLPTAARPRNGAGGGRGRRRTARAGGRSSIPTAPASATSSSTSAAAPGIRTRRRAGTTTQRGRGREIAVTLNGRCRRIPCHRFPCGPRTHCDRGRGLQSSKCNSQRSQDRQIIRSPRVWRTRE